VGTYRSVLALVRGGVSVEDVATDLGLREDAVRGMIQSMLREGHLGEFGCDDNPCTSCPMGEACGAMTDGPTSYFLTAEGVDYLTDGDEFPTPVAASNGLSR
jgi:hypothetical protein